ncbi:hypothetical protein TNCV_437481 [Trichonephila clavipes]|nr:hypothetical protein TNCV_437481 [Trichonephila clavipes]
MIPAYNKKRCARLFLSRRESISGEKTDFFPEEDTTKSYSGVEPEPIRLQVEGSQKGQDKLDLTKFSGFKFRSSCAKGVGRSSASSARNELKSAVLTETTRSPPMI